MHIWLLFNVDNRNKEFLKNEIPHANTGLIRVNGNLPQTLLSTPKSKLIMCFTNITHIRMVLDVSINIIAHISHQFHSTSFVYSNIIDENLLVITLILKFIQHRYETKLSKFINLSLVTWTFVSVSIFSNNKIYLFFIEIKLTK